MPYVSLGSRGPVTGAADTSGHNPGNWTVAFTPDILNVNVSSFEVYKINVNGASGSSFDVWVENWKWEAGIYGDQNTWDGGATPLTMKPGQTLYFCYSDPATDNLPPVVYIWLRYDPLGQS